MIVKITKCIMNLLNKIICSFIDHKLILKDIIYNENNAIPSSGFGLAPVKREGSMVFLDNNIFRMDIYECDRCGKESHKYIYKNEV